MTIHPIYKSIKGWTAMLGQIGSASSLATRMVSGGNEKQIEAAQDRFIFSVVFTLEDGPVFLNVANTPKNIRVSPVVVVLALKL